MLCNHLPTPISTIALMLGIVGGLACQQPTATPVAETGADPDIASVVLPIGDPELGRIAFLDLGCPECHRVPGDPDFRSQPTGTVGPDLGPGLRERPIGEIASAIISPSHALAEGHEADPSAGGASPMPDMIDDLTVGAWLDLLAYLFSSAENGDALVP